ncbi:MAG: TonB-dependent receptor [Gammaproteobacteria bacterium]|nr:TonB-dependent receptor [Gammaproteobacteria bacterium]
MKSFRSLSLGLCLAALPCVALAELGPIVITATRTEQPRNTSAATVYVLDSAAIRASGATTTAELLRGMPGVQVADLFGNGTEVTISVRGFSETANANTLVLVNGRRLNYSDTTGPDLHHVFPDDIERIELLAGSAGVLYGDQAVGGVINIITRRPEQAAHRVSARVGSYDYNGLQFNSSMQLNESFGYRISAETFSSDHYRDNNEQENTNFSGVLDYERGDDRVFVEFQLIDDELELPGALLEDEFEEDPQQSNPGFADDFINEDTTVYRIGYERQLGEQAFSIDATKRDTDADLRQSFRNFPSPEDGFVDRTNESVNPKLYGTFEAGVPVSYVVGIDLEDSDFDLAIPFDFFGPGVTTSSNEQETESFYFQLNPMIGDNLQLTFGMRDSSVENDLTDGNSFPDGIEVDDDITVAELGLVYRLPDGTRLSARIDENFRFAKVNELALAAPGEILDTQTGESFELGLETTIGNLQLLASIYRLDLEDEIVFDPNVGLFGENINLDETRRDGLTLSLFSQLSVDFGLRFELGLVEAEFRSGSFKGKDISGVSEQIAKLRGDYRVDDFVSLYLEGNYRSDFYAQGDNANQFGKIDSIKVYNAGVAYAHKALEIDFRINNLADESYAEFVTNNGFGAAYQPSPERNFFINAGYRFD